MPDQGDVCLFQIPFKELFASTEVFIHERLQYSCHTTSYILLALVQTSILHQSKILTERKKERKTILSIDIEIKHSFGVRQDLHCSFISY